GPGGYETARLIRGREQSRRTPILFLTAGAGDRPSLERAYSLGAVDHVVKPPVPAVLRAKVMGFAELFRKTPQVAPRAEQALRESEERFGRFMQHLPGLAWIKDLEGRYVYANQATASAFGAPRAALYGKTDEELFPPQTAAQFRENDRRALASGTGVKVVESLEHGDGTV